MSTDFVAALRAAANHIRKHQLDDQYMLSVEVNKNRDAVEVQVYGPDAFRAWYRSLRNVTAEAELYRQDTVIVDMAGEIPQAKARVRVYFEDGREPDVFAALSALLTAPDSREFEPIELPAILTDAAAAGGER